MISSWQINLAKSTLFKNSWILESGQLNATRQNYLHTLCPAYNEFGYNEHPAITSIFFRQKKSPLVDINVKKVHLQRVPLIMSKILWIKLLIVSGTQCNWWLVRFTLVVGLVFLPQNFWPMVGTYECHLLFCEHRWGGESTCRWWGHLNTTLCNQSCLNFLWSSMMGTQKPSLHCPHFPHALTPLVPLHPSHLPSYPLHLLLHPSPPHIIGYKGGRVQWWEGIMW